VVRLNSMKIGLDCIVGERFQTSVSFRVVDVPYGSKANNIIVLNIKDKWERKRTSLMSG
jgi:hypothetical protein